MGTIEYFYFDGNRFLIDNGVLKDVQVEAAVVRIPETVTEIRRSAFLDAKLLGRMEILFIPPSVRKIERLSFAGMANLKQVEVQAGIVTLEQGMFRNCMDLEFIYLPDTLRSIESRAFENCLKLRGVDLPRVWVKIAEDAFLNCVNLKDTRIDKAIEDAEYRRKKEEAEARKARFPHLYAEEERKKQKKVQEPEEPVIPVQETKVTEEKSAAEELLEAALLAEQPVFEASSAQHAAPPVKEETKEARFFIHEGVLERCEIQGSSVKIPEGVTALADRVFYGRKELTEIIFPSTLNYIGVQALEGTGWLENEREKNSYVIINGILVSAFHNSMVMEAKLPDTVYRIAPYAFYKSEAQLVIFSESVREVDAYAFVEAGVTEIDFSNRADVVVHTPIAVRCNQLKEIYVPGQLERLDENFVTDCLALKRVCLKWKQTVVNKKAFPENVRIWVL
ncbi:MAG: leucine-rich repeat domain-containing protein [Lachnospiraceae bacterium]|nr:leucine-rich repeat domain-containing protein [Lachnospiraceae bacterium]